MSSADAEHREEEEPLAGDDEDTGAQVAPIVRLEEVAVSTGEENEDAILDLYAFAFSDSFPVWIPRVFEGFGKPRVWSLIGSVFLICVL